MLDFYREVIETPLSLPDDIKKKLNLESRGRGRIWRIRVAGQPRRKPSLRKAIHAGAGRAPRRRQLVVAADGAALAGRAPGSGRGAAGCANFAHASKSAPGRAHALWTLHGLQSLTEEDIARALKDPEPGVREQALRLAEERLAELGQTARRRGRAGGRSVAARALPARLHAGRGDSPGDSDGAGSRRPPGRRRPAGRRRRSSVPSHGSGVGCSKRWSRMRTSRKRDLGARLQLLTRLAALVGVEGQRRRSGDALAFARNGFAEKSQPWQARPPGRSGPGVAEQLAGRWPSCGSSRRPH